MVVDSIIDDILIKRMDIAVFCTEAKYKFGNSYYCDDKAISHFKELAKNVRRKVLS
jgi:hypothetical protein